MSIEDTSAPVNDDVPLWGASRIKHLYGCDTEKELYAKIAAEVIKVPKIGGRLCDTPRRAREQIARLLDEGRHEAQHGHQTDPARPRRNLPAAP